MRTAILLALLLALTACGASSAAPATDATVPADPASAGTAQATLSGVLGGDADLEGGCVWLDTDDGRVEVVWPDGYRVTTDPVEVRDPDDAVVAAEGGEVTIEGAPAADRVSTCQVGEIWTATAVTSG